MQALIDRVGEIYQLGGPVVLVLALLSVFALSLIILRLLYLLSNRISEPTLTNAALDRWQKGSRGDAQAMLVGSRSAAGRTLRRAMAFSGEGNVSIDRIREDAESQARRELEAMRSGMRILDAIAQIAPLLGLFGTVLGMIEAFQALQSAGATVDPALLAGGIWVALLTTAVGLAVAIPVSLFVTWFDGRVDRARGAIEDALTRFFTDLQEEPGENSSAAHSASRSVAGQTLTPNHAA